MKPILIHADESCLDNQNTRVARKGACAAIVELPDGTLLDFAVPDPDTTNNRMAILSAITALELLQNIPGPIIFTSDSRYLIDAFNQRWINNWERNGWRGSKGPVENPELWQRLLPLTREREITWKWVKGHAADRRNNYANDLAIRTATTQQGTSGLVVSQFRSWEQNDQKLPSSLIFVGWEPGGIVADLFAGNRSTPAAAQDRTSEAARIAYSAYAERLGLAQQTTSYEQARRHDGDDPLADYLIVELTEGVEGYPEGEPQIARAVELVDRIIGDLEQVRHALAARAEALTSAR